MEFRECVCSQNATNGVSGFITQNTPPGKREEGGRGGERRGEAGKGREKVVPCPRLKVFEGESS